MLELAVYSYVLQFSVSHTKCHLKLTTGLKYIWQEIEFVEIANFLFKLLNQCTIWKFFRTSLFVPIYVLLFTNFGSQIGPFAVLRFFFLFVDQGFFGT